jgi:hypothetical protein
MDIPMNGYSENGSNGMLRNVETIFSPYTLVRTRDENELVLIPDMIPDLQQDPSCC